MPDKATIWFFREQMTSAGVMDNVWRLFHEFIDIRGLEAGYEFTHDITFIISDPGHQKVMWNEVHRRKQLVAKMEHAQKNELKVF
jgi:hypothetical protein